MKRLILLLLFALKAHAIHAQDAGIDSLIRALSQALQDTNKVNLYSKISTYNSYKYPDTVLYYASGGLELARKLNFKKGEIDALNFIGEALNTKGNFPKALEIKLQALQEAEKLNDPYLVASCQNYLGALYLKTEDYRKALSNYIRAKANQAYFREHQKYVLGMMGRCYFHLNNIDSAYYWASQSYELDVKDQQHWTVSYYLMAAIHEKKGKGVQALDFYRAGNQVANTGALDILHGYSGMASVFHKIGRQDSAIYYARKAVNEGIKRSLYSPALDASGLLTTIYKSDYAIDSAFKYQELMLALKDSLFSQDKIKRFQNLTFNEEQRQQQLEQARKEALQEYETKVKLYSLLTGLTVLSLIAFILYRNNQQKQQTNSLLEQKNNEIEAQRDDLEQTLNELRATQSHLVQREKMASLGELTAGIAHEIQNPLNFVNNFAEVNTELIDELTSELNAGNKDEAISIAGVIKQNQQKVIHHGKRAGEIVKGMFMHSRVSAGQKEPTDINALAGEYLRLSYHGIREKDNSFTVTLKRDFDKSIEKIHVVPQDLGTVLLNLYGNAFYAIKEKKKQLGEPYVPTVSVTTRISGDKILISVKDNGNGISKNILDKIFQPFFTTKPTGQGTGLGLSLSYDIIKAHEGEIKVNKTEGEGSEFIIVLPYII